MTFESKFDSEKDNVDGLFLFDDGNDKQLSAKE